MIHAHHRFEEILRIALRWSLLLGLLLLWLTLWWLVGIGLRGRTVLRCRWQRTIRVLIGSLTLRRIRHDNESLRQSWPRNVFIMLLARLLLLWWTVRLLIATRAIRVFIIGSALLNLLKVATQSVTTGRLDDWGWLASCLRLLLLVLAARVVVVFTLLLLLALLATINVVFQLNSHLSLRRLLFDEWTLEQLLCVRSLMIILDCKMKKNVN